MAIDTKTPAPLGGPVGQPSALASLGGTTKALQRVQQAATGKARTAGPIEEDILPEQVALQEAEQMQRVQQAQEQQLAVGVEQKKTAQEQEMQFGLQDMDEKEVGARQDLLNKSMAILQDFQQGRAKLEVAKDRAKMEQALFGMRLANKKYTDQLEIEGKRRRLDNAIQFKEALTEALFKEELDMLKSDIEFKRKLAADEREFEKLLASMDLETALRLAAGETEALQVAQIVSGSKEVISGGLKAAEVSTRKAKTEEQ